MIKLDIQMFASTNKTTNYDLPQFVGTDKPTWLGDFNEAMLDIDAGMHENATAIDNLSTDVDTATSTASQASQDVSNLTSTVSTLSTAVTGATATANNAQSTATSALNTANSANSKADTNTTAIGDLSNLTTTDKTSAVGAINEINQHINKMQEVILWTNPNPTSAFASQPITLSSSDYDVYEVVYASESTGTLNRLLKTVKSLKGYGTILEITNPVGSTTPIRARNVTYVSDTSLTFSDGYDGKVYPLSTDNNKCIPLYIIGYKTGLFN